MNTPIFAQPDHADWLERQREREMDAADFEERHDITVEEARDNAAEQWADARRDDRIIPEPETL